MPWSTEWTAPVLYLLKGEVRVFHTYKNGDIENGPRRFWFTLDSHCGEDECQCDGAGRCANVFDVRALATWKEPAHPPYIDSINDRGAALAEKEAAWKRWHENRIEEQRILDALSAAIAQGLLKGVPCAACR